MGTIAASFLGLAIAAIAVAVCAYFFTEEDELIGGAIVAFVIFIVIALITGVAHADDNDAKATDRANISAWLSQPEQGFYVESIETTGNHSWKASVTFMGDPSCKGIVNVVQTYNEFGYYTGTQIVNRPPCSVLPAASIGATS
ncbi:MAG TPA: hypothetical protein VLG92_04670 [Candidatus Saccharimonadia bacterium]|nr:hypothetical protein [Candidatus Saccharimonadia bacterium]